MSYIIGDKTFIKHLDDWVFKNTQSSAQWISNKKTGIPQMFRDCKTSLYRGMFVTQEFMDLVNSGKMVFNSYTSWTKDINTAKRFATDSTASGSKAKGEYKILIEKKINSNQQIIDIENFVLFMGSQQLVMLGFDEIALDSATKEKEVLCEKGIKILKGDVKFI